MKPVPSIPQHVTDPARVVVGVRKTIAFRAFTVIQAPGRNALLVPFRG